MNSHRMTGTDVDRWLEKARQTDGEEASKMIAHFKQLRTAGIPLFLTPDELERVARWKLDRQQGRQRSLRRKNTDCAVRIVTRAAFEVCDEDKDYEARLRIGILCSLLGIGIGIASATLALVEPERYATIDNLVWGELFPKEKEKDKRQFTTADYVRYLVKIREIAAHCARMPQQVDHALWLKAIHAGRSAKV